MTEQLAVLALFVFLYSLVAGRLQRTVISGPMIFVSAGFVMGPYGLGWFPGGDPRTLLRTLADLTLALFLFLDAAMANLGVLRRRWGIPSRMLSIGVPGAIALGFALALLMFPSLTVYEAAALGTMLAATDAALGKPVITNPSVPVRLREGLNVESGLNDGLCVPILLVFIALEVGEEGGVGSGLALTLIAEELGIGLLVGVGMTAAAAWLMRKCWDADWMTDIWIQITVVALAISCFALAQSLHGSGYIAAFTGGLLFGRIAGDDTHELVHSGEGIAETLALLTWLLFGIAVVGQVYDRWHWEIIAFALLSLTVIRMLPVYLSLMGSGESRESRLFLGWFGPRGLASIVFTIIVLDAELPGGQLMALVVTSTVILSLVLHGITANPWAARWRESQGSE